jgi:hypothetical protein
MRCRLSVHFHVTAGPLNARTALLQLGADRLWWLAALPIRILDTFDSIARGALHVGDTVVAVWFTDGERQWLHEVYAGSNLLASFSDVRPYLTSTARACFSFFHERLDHVRSRLETRLTSRLTYVRVLGVACV